MTSGPGEHPDEAVTPRVRSEDKGLAKLLRDPIWQAVGALVAVVGIALSCLWSQVGKTPRRIPTETSIPTPTMILTATMTPIPSPSARIEYSGFEFVDTKLRVEVKVRNTGTTILYDSEPSSGHIYQEGEIFQQSIAGTFKVGVDYAHREPHVIEYPYRWGLGRDLPPGDSTTVIGYIALKTPRKSDYWVGLVQEEVGWLERGVERTTVTLSPPKKPIDIYEFWWVVPVLLVIAGFLYYCVYKPIDKYRRQKQLEKLPPERIPRLMVEWDWRHLEKFVNDEFKGQKIVCEVCLRDLGTEGYDIRQILANYHKSHSKEVSLFTCSPDHQEWDMSEHLKKKHAYRGRVQQPIRYLKKRPWLQR